MSQADSAIVDDGPVQEKANLCNEQQKKMPRAGYTAQHMSLVKFVPAEQVFHSLQGCITSRTVPLSTQNKTNQVMYWKIFFRCHNY